MRLSAKIIFLIIIFATFWVSACSRGEKIIKVAEFPDTPEFQVDVGSERSPGIPDLTVPPKKVHIDLGYVWSQTKILYCPVDNSNGQYVGYTGDDKTYIKLKKSELDELTKKANVTIPESPPLSFWDTWGGKLIGVPILLILLLGFLANLIGSFAKNKT